MTWTPERIATLRELWADGLTASQIGAQMGVSRCAVLSKADRLDLPSRLQKTQRPANGPVIYLHPLKMKDHRPEHRKPTPSMPKVSGLKTYRGCSSGPTMRRPKKNGISILDVKDGHCKFPIKEDPTVYGGHRFCNEKAGSNSAYCEHHHKLATAGAPRPWTKAEDEFVLTHWRHGDGLIFISTTLDRGKQVVALRARQLRAA